ncbi:Hypothetical predicted protein, partial [Paramuricea clavata]
MAKSLLGGEDQSQTDQWRSQPKPGANLFPPRHGDTFFADQNYVYNFVEQYSKTAKEPPTDCSEFKSGEVNNMLRSKGRNNLFDEKGMFGRKNDRQDMLARIDLAIPVFHCYGHKSSCQ